MEGLTQPGRTVWLSRADNPKRKLKFTWELVEVDGQVLGVNTTLPNRFVKQLLEERRLPWLAEWPQVRAEKKYGLKSRIDFWLSDGEREHFLEVKNCHLLYPDQYAYFPDCVSARAAGHLHELCNCIDGSGEGVSAEVLFFVQIADAVGVRPSDLHDLEFAKAAREAACRGVRFSAVGISHTSEAMTVYGPIPVDLERYSLSSHREWREKNR